MIPSIAPSSLNLTRGLIGQSNLKHLRQCAGPLKYKNKEQGLTVNHGYMGVFDVFLVIPQNSICFTAPVVLSVQSREIIYNAGNITPSQGTGLPHIFQHLPLKGPHLQYYSLLIFLPLNCQFHILLAGCNL